MKRVILLVVGCLVLIGCTGKKESDIDDSQYDDITKLECTVTKEEQENTITDLIVMSFYKDKIKSIDMRTEVKLAEKYLNYMDNFEEQFSNSYNDFKDKKGIVINIRKTDYSIIINNNISVDELDEETKTKLNITDTYSNFDKTKKRLEGEGYTCKKNNLF